MKVLLDSHRLITSPDQRLTVDQIRSHPFFYGVDWSTIRSIDAPFVPHLRSITDTSYFPTDELSQVPDEPVGADRGNANKDLAFLGCVLSFQSRAPMHLSDVQLQLYIQAFHHIITRLLSVFTYHACHLSFGSTL